MISSSIINPSLLEIQSVLAQRLNPQNTFRSIHIVGTNGKGSVATFLELLYLEYFPEKNIAKYTSPHLKSVTERISVNASQIDIEEFDSLNSSLDYPRLTEFEKISLIAFEYFKAKQVDIAILEAGLGARWDATNTTAAENRLATVLTNIGWDHMDYLGDSLEQIRSEKEAIKRPGVLHFDGSKIQENYICDLDPNSINGVNFLLALEVFEAINDIQVSDANKIKLINAFKLRHRGRFDYDASRRILVDGAHNYDAAIVLNKYITRINARLTPKIFVLAFLDKQIEKIVAALMNEVFDPDRDSVIVTKLDSSRTSSCELVMRAILSIYPDANILLEADSTKAFDLALSKKTNQDLLVITGSLYLVGDYYRYAEYSNN